MNGYINNYMTNNGMYGYGNYMNGYLNYNYQNQQIQSQVIKVNGENGAKSLVLAPNCSALVLDENDPIVWLIQSDGAGYRTVSPYKITPFKSEPLVDVSVLEARIKRLEELLDEPYIESDAKPTDGAKGSNANNRHVQKI